MNHRSYVLAFALVLSCKSHCGPVPTPDAGVQDAGVPDATAPDAAPDALVPDAAVGSSLAVANQTDLPTTVYVAFGADSVVLPGAWGFCAGSGLNCNFSLGARNTQVMPLGGQYLNATFSFGTAVTCGTTKAEVNTNNPLWYSILDVSLVDGYSNNVSITIAGTGDAGTTTLGPPVGKTGNEKVVGLYPYGCDICIARQKPPCGISKGRGGCKSGKSQYAPDVICQWQGTVMGGGESVVVSLVN
jgi:hypothetical protein